MYFYTHKSIICTVHMFVKVEIDPNVIMSYSQFPGIDNKQGL